MQDPQDILEFQGKWRFLSNFYPCTIAIWNKEYTSSEAAYQASKCMDFQGGWALPEVEERIRLAATPGQAKRIGRPLHREEKFPHTPYWLSGRLVLMQRIQDTKYRAHRELAELLLSTGDARLVEGNPWGDTFWGVCRGSGENHMGKILMKVREGLRINPPKWGSP